MMTRWKNFVVTDVLWWLSFLVLFCQVAGGKTPGRTGGRVLLPNGWYVSPAGKQIALGGFPLRVVAVPHSTNAVVTDNGYGKHSVAVLDVRTGSVVSRVPMREGWMGLAVSADGHTVYASAGDEDRILVYRLKSGQLSFLSSIPLPKNSFPAGLGLSGDGRFLCATGNLSNSAMVVDLQTNSIHFNAPVGHKPFGCAFDSEMGNLYVTNWGGETVSVLNATSGAAVATIEVEAKPNDIVIARGGRWIFVANGDHNSVSVIDARTNQVMEQVDVSFLGTKLAGTMPNALALSSSGAMLYVANADNNCVAVLDVSDPSKSKIAGFIPTGWFPTGVAVVPVLSKDWVVVTNAKGGESYGIGTFLKPGETYQTTSSFPGQLMHGTVSAIERPSAKLLRRYTEQVRENWPEADQLKAAKPPFALGPGSPIRHVFYIIKENRTYDQVLGDMPQGNGDPRYTLFGENITPNEHALARQFTLIDNLYHNAEASATGHFWTDSAYSTEYVEKLWPSTYTGRGGAGVRKEYHDDDDDYPSSGFLWDECRRHNISYRSYGEFGRVLRAEPGHVRPAMKSLVGHVNPDYIGADAIATFSDLQRYEVWHKEFVHYEQTGEMPTLQVISLPGDHTLGTRPGHPTPTAMVAENDLVLGKMTDDISHSRFWKDTAIFVIEDDPQSGPDHVDCHRTTSFVLSPYVRRGFVDHQMYSSVSLLNTIEGILGLPPMTQYDGVATPLWALFQATPDPTPFTFLPARVDLEEKNTMQSYGAAESMKMPLDAADEADDADLNRIIWKSVRGSDSISPPPRVGGIALQWLTAARR